MSKRRLLFPVLIAVACISVMAVQSCTKLAKNLQYDLPLKINPIELTIPATQSTSASFNATQNSSYNIDSFIKGNTANVLGLSNITGAHITSCVITIDSPLYSYPDSSTNFANIMSCGASVYSSSNKDPYTVSLTDNPDVYATTITLPVDSTVDLKSYLNGSSFTYSLVGKLRRATRHDVRCSVQFTYKIHVQG